ncbi:glycosyltransferase [candidate division KSB1 bacterium]
MDSKFKIQISIIIPSFNSYKTIGKSIKYIENQSAYDHIIEIIIVDSSDDNTTKKLLSGIKNPKLKIIEPGIKVIPAKQRNIGAKNARGELFCFLDSDVYPDKNWLKEIINAYENGWEAGGGSFSIPTYQEKNKIVIAQYYLQLNEFIPRGKSREKRVIPAGNLFCSRVSFEKSGGYPEIRASEDSFFSCKLSEIVKLGFIPTARVYHVFREDKAGFLTNQYLLGKFVYIYRRLHYNNFYLKGIFPFLLFPLFMFVKFMRIFLRIPFNKLNHLIKFIKASPAFIIGLFAWYKGFISASKEYRNNQHFKSEYEELI